CKILDNDLTWKSCSGVTFLLCHILLTLLLHSVEDELSMDDWLRWKAQELAVTDPPLLLVKLKFRPATENNMT
ncbi:hypothetical protein Hamer_G010293, partial [Homarus americanus]